MPLGRSSSFAFRSKYASVFGDTWNVRETRRSEGFKGGRPILFFFDLDALLMLDLNYTR